MALSRPISSWDARQCEEWARSLGSADVYSKLADGIAQYGLDGAALTAVTDEDLQKDLGVSSAMVRRKLHTDIANLASTPTASTSTSVPRPSQADEKEVSQLEFVTHDSPLEHTKWLLHGLRAQAHPVVVTAALRGLERFCAGDVGHQSTHRATAVDAGLVAPSINALRRLSDHVPVQLAGADALLKLAREGEYQEDIILRGGVEAVLACMHRHTGHDTLMGRCCAALTNFSFKNNHGKMRILGSGGVDAVLLAMRSHLPSPVVGEQGCFALRNLAANVEVEEEIARKGGIQAVMAAMKAHPAVEVVQLQGSWALGNLAFHAANVEEMLELGVVQLLQNAMDAHPNSALVHEKGVRALKVLAQHTPNSRARLRALGGVSLLTRALKQHCDNKAVLKQVLWALEIMSMDPQALAEMQDADIGGTVAEGLEEYSRDAAVQKYGQPLLKKLSKSE